MKKKMFMIIQLLVFAGILGMFAYGFANTERQIDDEDLARVKQAIQKAALECYSIEGSYPLDISYLEKYYGLYLQTDLYTIRYDYIAGNIMPETNVYLKRGN